MSFRCFGFAIVALLLMPCFGEAQTAISTSSLQSLVLRAHSLNKNLIDTALTLAEAYRDALVSKSQSGSAYISELEDAHQHDNEMFCLNELQSGVSAIIIPLQSMSVAYILASNSVSQVDRDQGLALAHTLADGTKTQIVVTRNRISALTPKCAASTVYTEKNEALRSFEADAQTVMDQFLTQTNAAAAKYK